MGETKIAPIFKRIYQSSSHLKIQGHFQSQIGHGYVNKALAFLIGIPKSNHKAPFSLEIQKKSNHKYYWKRTFKHKVFKSSIDYFDTYIIETVGLLTFIFKIHRSKTEQQTLTLSKIKIGSIPLPKSIIHITSKESPLDASSWSFNIHVTSPFKKTVFRYYGQACILEEVNQSVALP